jgi:hypothetical protein
LLDHLERDGAPSTKKDLELLRDILSEAARATTSWNRRMYFVYLPTWEGYRIPSLASKDRDTVLRIVNDLSIPTIDVHLSFARHPDPLSLFPSRRYAHYNEAGHRLVAEQVLMQLEKEEQLAPGSGSLSMRTASTDHLCRAGRSHEAACTKQQRAH